MADPRFRPFGGLDRAIMTFILERLEAKVMRTDGPKSFNIELEFSRFLQDGGLSEEVATEVASRQRDLVRDRLSKHMQRWTMQGVPCPFSFVYAREETVISWRHEEFEDEGGVAWSTPHFVDVYDWIARQSERDFLFACLCFLKVLGCDPIFVTDGSRDEGIDCIGLISSGGLRSTALFVQAKSSADPVPGDHLLQMQGKYAGLPRTRKYIEYLDALGVGGRQDGAAFIYAVMTNGDFKFSAQQGAAKLGVLLRSRRQMAQALAESYKVTDLEALKTALGPSEMGDLTMNLAGRLVTPTR